MIIPNVRDEAALSAAADALSAVAVALGQRLDRVRQQIDAARPLLDGEFPRLDLYAGDPAHVVASVQLVDRYERRREEVIDLARDLVELLESADLIDHACRAEHPEDDMDDSPFEVA